MEGSSVNFLQTRQLLLDFKVKATLSWPENSMHNSSVSSFNRTVLATYSGDT